MGYDREKCIKYVKENYKSSTVSPASMLSGMLEDIGEVMPYSTVQQWMMKLERGEVLE